MRLHLIGLLAVVVLMGGATLLVAGEASVADLQKDLMGDKPVEQTPAQLDAAYAKVIDGLMPDMGNEDPGKRGGPQGTLERLAFVASRPGAEPQRLACSKAIAAKLTGDLPPLASVWMIRQLERIGRAEAVPALTKMLAEKDALVRESARRALQKNSSKEANDALQKALGGATEPAWRVGVINALADRRDPANLALLTKEAASDNDDIRSAAIVGLMKIGDKSAAVVIAAGMTKGSATAKRIAADAYLLLADALAKGDDKAGALTMYKKMLAGEAQVKCAAIIGVGRAGGVAELPTIFEALGDADAKVRGAGIEALGLLQGKEVTDAIAAKIKTSGPEMKPALLKALAQRGDKGTMATFVAAAEDADETTKVDALRGLGAVGDATVVPLLLKAAATAGKPQEAARESLERIKGDDVDKALQTAMDEKDVKVLTEVIRALSMRRVAEATPALLKAADHADGGVRGEALKALGAVAPVDSLAAVAAVLVKAQDDGTRNEAFNALISIAKRDTDAEKRAAPILSAMASATGPAKYSLLGVLGRIGGKKSLEAVGAAAKDTDAKVKEAAIRAMAEWPDDAAAKDLLDVANSGTNETLQVIAVRGYIRVCRLPSGRPAAETAKMLAAGLEAAKRPDEKKQALGGLAECRDILALKAVAPCMDDAALKEEAAQAAVRIAREVVNDGKNAEAVKAAMLKVPEVTKNQDAQKQAKEALDRAEQKLKEAAAKK